MALLCIYHIHIKHILFYLFIHLIYWWALRLIVYFSYCEYYCNEHERLLISLWYTHYINKYFGHIPRSGYKFKTQTIKLQKKTKGQSSMTLVWDSILGYDLKSIEDKTKNSQMKFHLTKKFLHSQGNNRVKGQLRVWENMLQIIHLMGVNIKNL